MLNSVLMILARDRYVSDGCEEAMAQGLAESYGRRWSYCYPEGEPEPKCLGPYTENPEHKAFMRRLRSQPAAIQ
jgi:hypothetical protein